MGIPSQNFRAVLQEVKQHIRAWVPVISLTKGLELKTRMRMTEIIQEVLPGHPVGVLTGPNLAREIMAGQAAAGVIAMEDEIIVQELQNVFKSGLFRVYTNTDVVGWRAGGRTKKYYRNCRGHGRWTGRRGQHQGSTHYPGPGRGNSPWCGDGGPSRNIFRARWRWAI